jgi:hypothetical protein
MGRFIHQLVDDKMMLLLIVSIGCLNILDSFCTLAWITYGVATEANPIMSYILDIGDLAFLSCKILIVSSCLTVLWFVRNNIWAKSLILPIYLLYNCVAGMHASFAWMFYLY